MELLRYFHPLSEKEELDPNGPLLRHVPPTVITSVNEELQNKRSAPKSRGEYMKINQERRQRWPSIPVKWSHQSSEAF